MSPILRVAWQNGIRTLDTAPNYGDGCHHQLIGAIKENALLESEIQGADDIRISSKVGFIPSDTELLDSSTKRLITKADWCLGHTLHPSYIDFSIRRSLAELRIKKLNLLFLHNPEVQIQQVRTKAKFFDIISTAFEATEKACLEGLVDSYGISLWNLFNLPVQLSVLDLVDLAVDVAGNDHRFRAIQMPISLVRMQSVHELMMEREGPLAHAHARRIEVWASSPLHGGNLPKIIDRDFVDFIDKDLSPAQACLLFTLSVPSISVVITSPSDLHQLSELVEIKDHSRLSLDHLLEIVRLLI